MLQDILKDKVNASGEEVLVALGLQRRPSLTQVIGTSALMLATGMLVGAAVAFLTAPKSGRALREQIKTASVDLADRIGAGASEAPAAIWKALSTKTLSAA